MTVLEALQMLKDYAAEEEKWRKSIHYKMPFHYYGFSNQFMTIHEKGAPPEKGHYNVHLDGSVFQVNDFIDGHPVTELTLNDLTGEYELYNPVQTYMCGYIIFNNKNINIEDVLYNLYRKINHLGNEGGTDSPRLCGISTFDSFSYDDSVEVEVFTIKNLIEYNVNRVKVGLNPYPFKKNIGKKSPAFYVKLVEFDYKINKNGKKARQDRLNKTITNLLSYIDEDCKWVEMKSQKPLYE